MRVTQASGLGGIDLGTYTLVVKFPDASLAIASENSLTTMAARMQKHAKANSLQAVVMNGGRSTPVVLRLVAIP